EPAGRSIALPHYSNARVHQFGPTRNRHSRFMANSFQSIDHHTAHALFALTFKMSHAAHGLHPHAGRSPALALASGSALLRSCYKISKLTKQNAKKSTEVTPRHV